MLRRVEEEAKSVYSEIPAALRVKTTELRAAQRRQANLVEYVADGEGTKAVRAELAKLEPRVEGLEKQLAGLRRASGKVASGAVPGVAPQAAQEVSLASGVEDCEVSGLLASAALPDSSGAGHADDGSAVLQGAHDARHAGLAG